MAGDAFMAENFKHEFCKSNSTGAALSWARLYSPGSPLTTFSADMGAYCAVGDALCKVMVGQGAR